MQKSICITLDENILIKIDRERGDVPRSKVIERAIQEKIGISSPFQLAGRDEE